MIYKETLSSPLGCLLMESDGKNILSLRPEEEKISSVFSIPEEKIPVMEETKRWLNLYFAGERPDFLPSLLPQGTEFQQLVWRILREIPYGETTTYGAVAARVAATMGKSRMSARAVGGAVGKNPILILIPCHRVLGADGSLTGFTGGLDRKRTLLRIEHITWKENR